MWFGGGYGDGGVKVGAETGVHDCFPYFLGNLNFDCTHFEEQFSSLARLGCDHSRLFVQVDALDMVSLGHNREDDVLTRQNG